MRPAVVWFGAMTQQIRALVVDDSQAMRRSLMYALQRLGPWLHTDEAQDGAEGLKKLTLGRYDLVLTDINMPLMDGLKLIRHIRQTDAYRTVPIVVITTESAVEDRERAMALGASAYLVKPVQSKVVLDTVKDLLKLH